MPDAPRFALPASRDGLLEVPITTVRVFERNWPAGGGGYFRLLPYALSRWLIAAGQRASTGSRRSSISTRGRSIPAQPRVAGHRRQDALSPLRQPRPHGAAARAPARATSAGTAWTHLPARRAHDADHASRSRDRRIATSPADRRQRRATVRSRATPRAGTPSSRRCPDATFFHRAGWQRRHRATSSAIDTHFLLRRARRRASPACCRSPRSRAGCSATRWSRCRSASMAAPAATDAEARDALIDAARRLRASARRRPPGIPQPRAPRRPDWPQQDLYVTFRKAIAADDEANMQAIPRKQRAMVRKGIKQRPAQRDRRRASTASSRCTPTTCTATARRRSPKRYFDALQRSVRRRLRGADRHRRRRPAAVAA